MTHAWPDKILDAFGPLALPLRTRYILSVLIAVSAIVIAALPKIFTTDDGSPHAWTTPVIIVFAVVAALSVAIDRIGDDYQKRQSATAHVAVVKAAQENAALEYEGSVATAERSVSELNIFLLEAIEVSFLEASSRSTEVLALRRHLARSAANAIGPNTRATYYTLLSRVPGNRILGDPQHGATVGRRDKPERPWREVENPDHDVWAILNAPDEHPDVHEAPDEVRGLNWELVRYDTFLTIPVKAHGVVFGLLSVNNASAGSIGEVQRSVILAMARVMALVLALDTGARTLKGHGASGKMSDETDTLYQDEEAGKNDE
jgi:hypothetical protein